MSTGNKTCIVYIYLRFLGLVVEIFGGFGCAVGIFLQLSVDLRFFGWWSFGELLLDMICRTRTMYRIASID